MHLSIDDILLFRKRTKEFYDVWEIELTKLENKILEEGIDFSNQQIQGIIDQEIAPQILKLKNDIINIRDEMFSKILKVVKNTALSLIAGGTLSAISIPAAIAGFIAFNIKNKDIADAIIDNYFSKKKLYRESGLTYILKVNQVIDKAK